MKFALEWRPLAGLRSYGKNARVHGAEQLDRLAASLREFGWMRPLLITATGEVIAGHGALQAALRLGLKEAPCAVRDHLTPEQVKAYRLADNQLALLAGWDFKLLAEDLRYLLEVGYDAEMSGFDEAAIAELCGNGDGLQRSGGSLAAAFGAPPFSVFDARQDSWRERKNAWLALGMREEIGKGGR